MFAVGVVLVSKRLLPAPVKSRQHQNHQLCTSQLTTPLASYVECTFILLILFEHTHPSPHAHSHSHKGELGRGWVVGWCLEQMHHRAHVKRVCSASSQRGETNRTGRASTPTFLLSFRSLAGTGCTTPTGCWRWYQLVSRLCGDTTLELGLLRRGCRCHLNHDMGGCFVTDLAFRHCTSDDWQLHVRGRSARRRLHAVGCHGLIMSRQFRLRGGY